MIINSKYALKIGLLFILILLIGNLSLASNELDNDSLYKEASSLLENREFQKVISLLSDAIKDNPDKPAYHVLMGLASQELNENEEAKKHYEKAIELDSAHVEAYLGRGMASSELSEQEYWYTQALEKSPSYMAAYALLVSLYFSQAIEKENSGDVIEAIKLLEKVRKLDKKLLTLIEVSPDRVLKENADFIAHVPNFNLSDQKESLLQHIRNLDKLEEEWKENRGYR